mmetsp:Transcript_89297/g.227134  ORF Transcript_89297/g.227134 Transcript_89297/m.227134 type:complete len:83 (-) Transcript_89297:128-376(-)
MKTEFLRQHLGGLLPSLPMHRHPKSRGPGSESLAESILEAASNPMYAVTEVASLAASMTWKCDVPLGVSYQKLANWCWTECS